MSSLDTWTGCRILIDLLTDQSMSSISPMPTSLTAQQIVVNDDMNNDEIICATTMNGSTYAPTEIYIQMFIVFHNIKIVCYLYTLQTCAIGIGAHKTSLHLNNPPATVRHYHHRHRHFDLKSVYQFYWNYGNYFDLEYFNRNYTLLIGAILRRQIITITIAISTSTSNI